MKIGEIKKWDLDGTEVIRMVVWRAVHHKRKNAVQPSDHQQGKRPSHLRQAQYD